MYRYCTHSSVRIMLEAERGIASGPHQFMNASILIHSTTHYTRTQVIVFAQCAHFHSQLISSRCRIVIKITNDQHILSLSTPATYIDKHKNMYATIH